MFMKKKKVWMIDDARRTDDPFDTVIWFSGIIYCFELKEVHVYVVIRTLHKGRIINF